MENEIKILKKKERKRQNKNRGKEKVVRVGKRVKNFGSICKIKQTSMTHVTNNV